MAISGEAEVTVEVTSPLIHGPWEARLARWVSAIISPPVLGVAGVVWVAAYLGTRAAWGWALVYMAGTITVPVVYILWLVQQGRVTDFNLQRREQRLWPYLLTLACMLVTSLLLRFGAAPPLLVALALAGVVQTLGLLVITLRWKISVHATSVAGFVALAIYLVGELAWPLVLLPPLVGWSRFRLRRHDLGQLVGGTLLGSFVMATMLWATPH